MFLKGGSDGNPHRELTCDSSPQNILKYILAEAKEKKQPVFQQGWKMVVNKTIPQQKNDNDCGVFVLEVKEMFLYSRAGWFDVTQCSGALDFAKNT